MKYPIYFLLLSALAGCSCYCKDKGHGFVVNFNIDTTKSGFSTDEINHIKLVQTGKGKTDSLALRTVTHLNVVANTLYYYIETDKYGEEWISPYTYRFMNPSAGLDITISDIRTKNVSRGKGGCACWENEELSFSYNGVPKREKGLTTSLNINKP